MKINLKTANDLIRRYRQARAVLEETDQKEKELSEQVLRDGDFRNEDTGDRITDYQTAYMMSEASFDRFLRERYELECAAGIMDPDGYEYAATRQPAAAVKRAEDDMIAYMIDTMPDIYAKEAAILRRGVRDYRMRQHFIDITLKLNVPANRITV